MQIKSPSFENQSAIPARYSCDGENINPPLEFNDIPKNAKSLVLIMEDPDVPKNLKPDGMFDHWIVFNVPPTINSIAENSTPQGVQALNSKGSSKYTGPCPPDRQHRYFFKLFALDSQLNLDSQATKKDVEAAMENHIIDKAELVGVYDRKSNTS